MFPLHHNTRLNLLCHIHSCEENHTYINVAISPVISENRVFQTYRPDNQILFACNRRLKISWHGWAGDHILTWGQQY